MKSKTIALFTIIGLVAPNLFAINVDLSGASSGAVVTAADGSSFAESFIGQTINGTALTGSPGSPLTLQAGGTLSIDSFNGFNTILPQPNNQGPLALLLSQPADAISWQMGWADGSDPLTINFYDVNGNVVHNVSQVLTAGYDTYSFSGFGAFAGLAISDDNDGNGLRFYDFEFTPASQATVPDTGASMLLFLTALLPLLAWHRRFQLVKVSAGVAGRA